MYMNYMKLPVKTITFQFTFFQCSFHFLIFRENQQVETPNFSQVCFQGSGMCYPAAAVFE